MQAQLAQVNRSLDCERVQAAADDMQVSLNKVKGQIEEYLERRYHDYPEGRELARLVLNCDNWYYTGGTPLIQPPGLWMYALYKGF